MWPFSKAKTVAARAVPVLPVESLEAGIMAVSGRGIHLAGLYATMLGFEYEVLREPAVIQEFVSRIQSPPDFTEEGVERAVQHVIESADIMCKGGTFETLVYGSEGKENASLRPVLDPYQRAVGEFGAQTVFSTAGFDVASFIKRTALARRKNDLALIFAKLDEKRPFLAPLLMRARAKGRNKYGDVDLSEFVDELVEFLKTYFDEVDLKFFYNRYPLSLCLNHIQPWLVEAESDRSIPTDGIDFEHWCAARIEEQGWYIRVSKASGDQGIDIEAMKDDFLVAIQCKRYTQPIGNKSVQEAVTGAAHYRAQRAVVIGTGGFTRAALELAASTGAILIDAENIGSFTELVTGK